MVDDRRRADAPLPVPPGVRVVRRGAAGARAGRGAQRGLAGVPRRTGSRSSTTTSSPSPAGSTALAADLAAAGPDVGGVQGRVVVPLPPDRRPTDWERNTRGLERARWATADLAYRRAALEAAGGFDERFPRAYREDADLGLRITAAGRRIVTGERVVRHPVRPAPAWVSVAKQAGNADDVLMRALHGRGWRARAGVPAGRRPRHLAVAAAGALSLAALAGAPPRVGAVAGRRLARRDRRAGLGADRPRPAHAARGGDDAVDERGDPVRGVGLVAGRPRDAAAPPARAGPRRRRGSGA